MAKLWKARLVKMSRPSQTFLEEVGGADLSHITLGSCKDGGPRQQALKDRLLRPMSG